MRTIEARLKRIEQAMPNPVRVIVLDNLGRRETRLFPGETDDNAGTLVVRIRTFSSPADRARGWKGSTP